MARGVAMATTQRVDGVVVGLLMGFRRGAPLVVFPGNPQEAAIPARSTVRLEAADIGTQLALAFEDGDAARPLVLGKLLASALGPEPAATAEPERLTLTAGEAIELHVGKASLLMHSDGRITLRGARIVSQASGANRIRGGSVHLN